MPSKWTALALTLCAVWPNSFMAAGLEKQASVFTNSVDLPQFRQKASVTLEQDGTLQVKWNEAQSGDVVSTLSLDASGGGAYEFYSVDDKQVADLKIIRLKPDTWMTKGGLDHQTVELDSQTRQLKGIEFMLSGEKVPATGRITTDKSGVAWPFKAVLGASKDAGIDLNIRPESNQGQFTVRSTPFGVSSMSFRERSSSQERYLFTERREKGSLLNATFKEIDKEGNTTSAQIKNNPSHVDIVIQQHPTVSGRADAYKEVRLRFEHAAGKVTRAIAREMEKNDQGKYVQKDSHAIQTDDAKDVAGLLSEIINNRTKVLGSINMDPPPELVDLFSLLTDATGSSILRAGHMEDLADYFLSDLSDRSRGEFISGLETVLSGKGFDSALRLIGNLTNTLQANISLVTPTFEAKRSDMASLAKAYASEQEALSKKEEVTAQPKVVPVKQEIKPKEKAPKPKPKVVEPKEKASVPLLSRKEVKKKELARKRLRKKHVAPAFAKVKKPSGNSVSGRSISGAMKHKVLKMGNLGAGWYLPNGRKISQMKLSPEYRGEFALLTPKKKKLADLEVMRAEDGDWHARGDIDAIKIKTYDGRILSFDQIVFDLPHKTQQAHGTIYAEEFALPWTVRLGMGDRANISLQFDDFQNGEGIFSLSKKPTGQARFEFLHNHAHGDRALYFEKNIQLKGLHATLVDEIQHAYTNVFEVMTDGKKLTIRLKHHQTPKDKKVAPNEYRVLDIAYDIQQAKYISTRDAVFVKEGKTYKAKESFAIPLDPEARPDSVMTDIMNNYNQILGADSIDMPPAVVDIVAIMMAEDQASLMLDAQMDELASFFMGEDASEIQMDVFNTAVHSFFAKGGFNKVMGYLGNLTNILSDDLMQLSAEVKRLRPQLLTVRKQHKDKLAAIKKAKADAVAKAEAEARAQAEKASVVEGKQEEVAAADSSPMPENVPVGKVEKPKPAQKVEHGKKPPVKKVTAPKKPISTRVTPNASPPAKRSQKEGPIVVSVMPDGTIVGLPRTEETQPKKKYIEAYRLY